MDRHHLIIIAVVIVSSRRGRFAAVAEEAFDAPREDLPAFAHVGPVPVVHKQAADCHPLLALFVCVVVGCVDCDCVGLIG